jgi:hypothetical protein
MEKLIVNKELAAKVRLNNFKCLCKIETPCPCLEWKREKKCVCGLYTYGTVEKKIGSIQLDTPNEDNGLGLKINDKPLEKMEPVLSIKEQKRLRELAKEKEDGGISNSNNGTDVQRENNRVDETLRQGDNSKKKGNNLQTKN